MDSENISNTSRKVTSPKPSQSASHQADLTFQPRLHRTLDQTWTATSSTADFQNISRSIRKPNSVQPCLQRTSFGQPGLKVSRATHFGTANQSLFLSKSNQYTAVVQEGTRTASTNHSRMYFQGNSLLLNGRYRTISQSFSHN